MGYCVLLVQIFHAGFVIFHLTKGTLFFKLLLLGFPGIVPFATLVVFNGVNDRADDPKDRQQEIQAEKQNTKNRSQFPVRLPS